MKTIIDLTYSLSPETAMFPGLPQPEFRPYFTLDEQGANVTQIRVVSHAGTHIDAPSHMLDGGQTLDEIEIERLIGDAAVLDLTKRANPASITRADLETHDATIAAGDIVIVVTGIYREYGTPAYNESYPPLAPEAAEWLAEKRIAAYATDATSVEDPDSNVSAHRILLGHGIPIIENLANLDALTAPRVQFIALPVKLKGLDGGPCRVVALQ